ncbi:hypothetical protein [Peribacillus frigoritolerans]|uniref:hypothetical protein n=1 Tax=Peribacillus frigoritolerans TaxID=450367 RepID=UPI00119B6B89|nr:hypothetical protein [Peribacillus frigoritolerans]MDG4850365.1 hypothetical protein [Peribacillus frigoritolerans]TWE00629.1 hypothetical protein FB545_2966 [Peribacillus frigoritolerans]
MPNRVQNGGFEQSTPGSTNPAPFWTGTNVLVELGAFRLLGLNNILINPGGNISQVLLPLDFGQLYNCEFAFTHGINSTSTGALDVAITGNSTRSFNTANMTNRPYAIYNFDFTAASGPSTLTITNNSTLVVRLDKISVKAVE